MPVAAGLYYFAHGAEDKARPPVVLIHGAGGNHLHWPVAVRRLPGQRILAPDLPGHGKSEGIGHHTVEDYAQKILEFLTELEHYSVVLVGHSMGGAIAISIALQEPERVAALGLVGSGAKLRVAPAILNQAANPAGFEQTVHMITDASFSAKTNPRLKQLAMQRMLETRPAVLYGDLMACDQFDSSAQLSGLSMPALAVCGADDQMTPPRYSEFLREHISGARLAVVPDAGHMVMLEQPGVVSGLLTDFLHSSRSRL
jgi:pimeloyl-ACP methyl ester carboxylesterase